MKGVIEFFKQAYQEFKKVKWPTKNETIRLTSYVIGVSFGLGLFVSGFDYLFKEALKLILIK